MTTDQRYREYIAAPSDDTLNIFIAAVRTQAYQQVLSRCGEHADDIAQDVAFTTLQKLSAFKPADYYAVTRWVAAITTNHRLKYATAKHPDQWNSRDEQPAPEQQFFPLSDLNDETKEIATHLLSGRTLKETARELDTSDSALRQKLFRRRNKKPRKTDV